MPYLSKYTLALVGEIAKFAKERTKREQKGKERVKKQNS